MAWRQLSLEPAHLLVDLGGRLARLAIGESGGERVGDSRGLARIMVLRA